MKRARTGSTQKNRLFRLDVVLALSLAVLAGSVTLQRVRQIPVSLYTVKGQGYDIWFDADLYRVYSNMSSTWSNHRFHTRKHPLFILTAYPMVKSLRILFCFSPIQAVQGTLAIVAALWAGLFFAILRKIGCLRLDAMLFTMLGLVSASTVFWSSMTEIWMFGSLSILLVVLVAALEQHRPLGESWYVLTSAFALGMTVTNWMAGLIASFVMKPWRRALQIAANALCVVTLLWALQAYKFYELPNFLVHPVVKHYMLRSDLDGPKHVLKAFFGHAMIMPAIEETVWGKQQGLRMTVQYGTLGSASAWGKAGLICWMALFGFGFWSFVANKPQRRFVLTVGLIVAGQLGLHLIYGGEETFLYSMHWLPLLILIAAFGTLTDARRWVVGLTAMLVVCTAVNNQQQFTKAVGAIPRLLSTHGKVK